VVSGEAIKSPKADERPVDAPGRIMVTPVPRAGTAQPIAPAPPVPVKSARPAAPARRRGGAWLVVLVYILSAGALGYAIWERFLRT
jgi:hypothetical protein